MQRQISQQLRKFAILAVLLSILIGKGSAVPLSASIKGQQQQDQDQDWSPQQMQLADDDAIGSSGASNDSTDPITAMFTQSDLILGVGEEASLSFRLSGRFSEPGVYLYFTYQEEAGGPVNSVQQRPIISHLADVAPPSTNQSATSSVAFTVVGVAPGHVIIGLNSTSPEFENRRDRFVRIRVIRSYFIDLVNYVVGILYVICWSASYYPQTWLNYTRKSVVGLNFDFVSLNIVGFFAYSVFNMGLYCVRPLQEMYYAQHPRGVIPVQLADCIFALHCLCITIVQGLQCIVYERGGQRISWPGRLLLGCMISFLLICLVLAWAWPGAGLTWLQYVYFASYVKLAVTLTKYTPQAYMNYRRKSTEGWSIGQVHLDFAGGVLSIGQMLLLAYNYSDWESLLGDPTKLGLGVVSIAYDCLFFVQHYRLYGPGVNRGPSDDDHLGQSSVEASISYQSINDDKNRLL